MDTIMFTGGGLFFIFLGLFLRKKHQQFMASSIIVNGKIVDIVEKVNISRNTFGGIEDKRIIWTPIVQYKYNKLYEFQSEVDANSHGLKKQSNVDVLIDPLKPKVAKLTVGAKDSSMLMLIMIGLGSFLSIIGLILFNPNDFDIGSLTEPFPLLVTVFAGTFFYVKIWPILSMFAVADIYTENAKEVEE